MKKKGVSFSQSDADTKDIITMAHKIIAYLPIAFKTDKARILC